MKIETERLVIRDFQKRDVVGLLEYLSNPRVNCFAADRLCSEEAAFVYMQYSQKDMQRYAVSLKKEDFIIGDVFVLRENEDTYNVGWHFNKRFEGKGLAREAVIGLLDYLFREAGARRIYGFVEDDNILRSKGMVEGTDGMRIYFDMVPEEHEVRTGAPEYTGRICVIGAELNEDKLAELFKVK